MDGAALDGVLVVALEQAVAAPFCTSRLADAGARVIKIERPEGDFARAYDHIVHGQSAYFAWLNRGKESVCLDIKDDTDRRLLHAIIGEADVFVQNLAPGAAPRAGFASDELRARYPTLITVDISGYGEDGRHRDRKAYDLLVQCESGLASVTGCAVEPGRVGVSVCDIACGMYAHAAVLEALIERGRRGRGRGIRVSLFDSIADWMTVPLLQYEYGGAAPPRVGLHHPSIAPYGAYRCGDGEAVVIAIQNEREWRRFCELVLQRAPLAADCRFRSNTDRCAHREALDAAIDDVLSGLDREQAVRRLETAGIAFASLNSVADLSGHEALRRLEMATPGGPARLVAPPARVSGVQATGLRPLPALGEHTDAVRREFARQSRAEGSPRS